MNEIDKNINFFHRMISYKIKKKKNIQHILLESQYSISDVKDILGEFIGWYHILYYGITHV